VGVSVDDRITVIITASPRPADPDTSMLLETIASIRRYLPTVNILIGCDGVRDEQPERADPYADLVAGLAIWASTQGGVSVIHFMDHRHQTGMVTHFAGAIDTPFVLFMEQDAPLEGDISFPDILATMHGDKLNVVRFLHEVAVHDEAAHLFLERTPTKGRRYVRTVQYSSRPQVVRTSVMRQWTEMWGPKTRSMIEDFLYGWYEHGLKQYGLRDTWARGRMAIWAPGPNMKHSGHLDGRGSDPKFPIHIEVEGETPPGSPHNGDYDIGGIYS
jgi:hypothetical protein